AAGWPSRFLFVLSLIGLAYTHPLALLSALAIGIYHVLFARPVNRRWLVSLGLMVLSGAIFMPWLLILLRAVDIARADVTRQAVSLSSSEIVTQLFHAFAGGSVALFALLVALSPNKRPSFRLLVVWAVSGLLAALAINLWLPVFVHIRYLMALWPALALLIAFAVFCLQKHSIASCITQNVWMLTGLHSASTRYIFTILMNAVGSLPDVPFEGVVRCFR